MVFLGWLFDEILGGGFGRKRFRENFEGEIF